MRAVDCDVATAPDHAVAPTGAHRSLIDLRSIEEAEGPEAHPDARVLADWVRQYLMRTHPDLGRTGHVCPFTAKAVRLALLRIGISPFGPADRPHILQTMQDAMQAFHALPSTRATRVFRTIIVGFPNCADPDGIAALQDVQNAMRHHSVVRGKMLGLFEPDSKLIGLINPDFRPLRSPIPVLAIRMLVEQDAPFVARNPLLAPIYLLKFPLAGSRRLFLHFQAERQRRAENAVVTNEKRP